MLRSLCRQGLAARPGALLFHKSAAPMGVNYIDPYKQMDEYWKRNRQLNRPLSPHLSIYKPQLTSMLSLCHRVTGIAMALTISGVSITLLALPGDFPTYLNMVKDLSIPAAVIIPAKYIIAFPVSYHYINGIRHLAWDWAWGFGLQRLYKTGWFCLTMAVIVASTFVFYW